MKFLERCLDFYLLHQSVIWFIAFVLSNIWGGFLCGLLKPENIGMKGLKLKNE